MLVRYTSIPLALVALFVQPWLEPWEHVADPAGAAADGRGSLVAAPGAEEDTALAKILSLGVMERATRDPGMEELQQGLSLLRSGDYVAARAAFERAANLLPQLIDWARMLAADAAAYAGDTVTAARLVAATGPVMAREWGWRVVVRAHRLAGDTIGAIRSADEAARLLGNTTRGAEALRVAGELRLLAGDTAGAITTYRQVVDMAPSSSHGLAAALVLAELPGLTADDRLKTGRLFLQHGKLNAGIAGLEAYLKSGQVNAADRPGIRLEIGRAHFRARRYKEAEKLLLAVSGEATGKVAAEALFYAGRAQFRQGRGEIARETFRRVAERFPDEPAAAEALFILADLDHDDGRIDVARQRYLRAMEIRPDATQAAQAAMRVGGIHYLAGDYRTAADVFERYRRIHPKGTLFQQATFWLARVQLKAGQSDTARARLREVLDANPVSYYAMRASELLGDQPWYASLTPSPATAPQVEQEVQVAMARIDALKELGLSDAAAYEMDRTKRQLRSKEGALYTLAEALNERGDVYTGILLGREIQRRDGVWNERLLRIIYPFPHQDRVVAESRKNGLDPFLVAGLIRQESMFNARAVSAAGAIGLMQVMPATGRKLAAKAGLKRITSQQLKDPDINIRLGTIYLAELLGRYGGRVPDALAAYNAGPTRLVRWREFPEYVDDDLFAERIPFAETRDYVKVVQQNAAIYAMLYGTDRQGALGRSVGQED